MSLEEIQHDSYVLRPGEVSDIRHDARFCVNEQMSKMCQHNEEDDPL